MRTTKNWGFTNSGAELHMLAHAERTRKRLVKKKQTSQRLPAFKERTRKELERESARSNQNTSKHHRQRSRVFQYGER